MASLESAFVVPIMTRAEFVGNVPTRVANAET